MDSEADLEVNTTRWDFDEKGCKLLPNQNKGMIILAR